MNKSKRRESYNQSIRIREEEDSISRLNLKGDKYITNTSTNRKNNIAKGISIVKTRDKEVSKEVVNNNIEVFNTFNNSRDKDY